MFTRGLRGGVGRLGEFVNRDYKNENWLPNTFGSHASLIPGVSNASAAAAGGGIIAALAAAWAAWKLLK